MPNPSKKDIEENVVSGASWDEFCEHLKRAGQQILRPETPSDPLNRAEGFRYLSRLTRIALNMYMESGDPKLPNFYSPSDSTSKIGADNPDNLYLRAEISSEYEYRIKGKRGSVHYLGFVTLRGGYGEDGQNQQTGDLDHQDIHTNPDGSFEIIISEKQHPQNWLPMLKDTSTLLVRQTFLDRSSEQAAEITIERIGSNGETPEPLSAIELDRRLRSASAFVEGCARLFGDWAQGYQERPNQLPPADQAVCQAAGGDPNIFYYHGYWELKEDEALLIELDEIPECETWNFQLNNYWMESLDYRYHRITVNKHTARKNDNGKIQLIVAHQDPGFGNWIDTAGHKLGTMCFRWIRASHHPHPNCRLVKIAELT